MLTLMAGCVATPRRGIDEGSTTPKASVRFAAIGDFGVAGPQAAAVAQLVHGWEPDFVVTLGDNNYPDGGWDTIEANIGQYYSRYIAFDAHYRGPYYRAGEPQVAQRFFATLGNHDWHTAGAEPHLAYFDLPGNERYYEVRQGPVGLFILDSDPREPDGITVDSRQAQWLRQALADSTAPWKVVVLHHAPFSTGDNGPHPALQWPYQAWGAHLVMAGHDHNYERTQVDHLPYVVCGVSGAPLDTWYPPAVPLGDNHVVVNGRYGALRLAADAQALTLEMVDVEGTVQDSLKLRRPADLLVQAWMMLP